jgi:hypothetical protein
MRDLRRGPDAQIGVVSAGELSGCVIVNGMPRAGKSTETTELDFGS